MMPSKRGIGPGPAEFEGATWWLWPLSSPHVDPGTRSKGGAKCFMYHMSRDHTGSQAYPGTIVPRYAYNFITSTQSLNVKEILANTVPRFSLLYHCICIDLSESTLVSPYTGLPVLPFPLPLAPVLIASGRYLLQQLETRPRQAVSSGTTGTVLTLVPKFVVKRILYHHHNSANLY